MKKEELLEIGLTEEQVSKVFALNGLDVEREKAKTIAAQTELTTAKEQLSAAQTELTALKQSSGDAAAVQRQLTDLQAKYDADTAALNAQLTDRDYSDAITRAIAGKGLKFSSKSAERAFAAALRDQKLELKDGELSGLDDFIKAQKESDPDAFAPDKAPPRFVGGAGGRQWEPPKQISRAAQLAAEHHASLYGGETKKE